MKKVYNSLQTKLIASFVLLILVIAGGTLLITLRETRQALLESTRDDLGQLIGIAPTQLTPEEIATISRLKPGEDEAPAYLALIEKFQHMRAQSGHIVNFYIMRVDDNRVVFLLDDASLTERPAKIGQVYDQPEVKVFEAVNGIQTSANVYTDEWADFLSGYAPIQGADGKTVFILGADMLATKVVERQNFIGATIYFIIGMAILMAAVIIGLFSVTIIRDIKKLNLAAQKISTGETNVQIDVQRNDEIGELSRSFERMVTSLNILMDTDENWV